jgi:4-alpha-glucanotransferase
MEEGEAEATTTRSTRHLCDDRVTDLIADRPILLISLKHSAEIWCDSDYFCIEG